MKQFKYYLMAAFVAAATCTGFSSCSDNDDEESTVNPAVDVVTRTKQHDTAILLCTFGSTYNESLSVYDDVIEDFKAKFPNTDIYMSFTSRTCIGRVEASTGIFPAPRISKSCMAIWIPLPKSLKFSMA